ncbi:MAG: LacI family DNA-binding transcriptional regulator [Limnochordia bacterium]|nr:LacI family DNA-binding transcriptional regulator [Limnochordia bacterium]
MRKSRVTLKDIAKVAGVSAATVSHVLNNTAPISAETTARVLKIVKDLNYEPNMVARNLRKQESRTIAFISNTVMGDLVPDMMGGAMQASVDRGYNLIVGESRQKVGAIDFHQWLVSSHQVGGLLFCSNWVTEVDYHFPAHTPAVYLYCYAKAQPRSSVLPDSVKGGYTATAHLLSIGRQRIAYIGGKPDWKCTKDRWEGYHMAHRHAKVPYAGLVDYGDWTIQGGYRAATRLLERDAQIDAFFVANDLMAVGVMDAVREYGLEIPHDVSIVGYDDVPVAIAARPALTTVKLPNYDMGYAACNLLIDKIERSSKDDSTHKYDCKLVIRDSCGAEEIRLAERAEHSLCK